MPFYGTWSADVLLATSETIPTKVTLQVGSLSLSGTVVRTASFAGSRSARIVGGGGGWRKTIPSKGYSHPGGLQLSTVLNDAARESGETISISSDVTLGTSWTRSRAKAEQQLHLLTGGRWWGDPSDRKGVG